jgi:hypothetical protein
VKYPFHLVDVFSSTPFGGKQLAILPDATGISTEGMQKIAREFNFPESTFVLPRTISIPIACASSRLGQSSTSRGIRRSGPPVRW